MIVMVVVVVILVLKLYSTMLLENIVDLRFYDLRLQFYNKNKNLSYKQYYTTFTSSFGDSILILSLIVGLICLQLLGQKDLTKSLSNFSLFCIINLIVMIMITTNNLLIMFICFELIFLPSI